MNEKNSPFIVGILVGMLILLVLGSLIFRATGWDEAIRYAKNAKEELRDGLRGVEESLGLARGSLETIDDLAELVRQERILYNAIAARVGELEYNLVREREALTIAQSAAEQANLALGEIRKLIESGNFRFDELIEKLVALGL